MTPITRVAQPDDVASWLELVPEVESLFGPMPDLETHLRRGVARGTAIVVADGGQVAAERF